MAIEITTLASSSAGNCYRVTDGSTPLLLEAGISFKEIQRRLNFRTSELAACLISHEHKDHCKAVNDLLKMGIRCYMSAGTAEAINSSIPAGIKVLRPMEQIKIGTWAVIPFAVQHDAAEPFGYYLASMATGERLLFATDTYYIKPRFAGLTHLMIECNYSIENVASDDPRRNRLMQSHFSIATLKDFLRANDLTHLKEIHLLHMSNDHGDAERFKREVQELTGVPVYVA